MQPLIVNGGDLDSLSVTGSKHSPERRNGQKRRGHGNHLPLRHPTFLKRVEDEGAQASSADSQEDRKEISHARGIGGIPGDDRGDNDDER